MKPRAPISNMTTINRNKALPYYAAMYRFVMENGWDKRAYVHG